MTKRKIINAPVVIIALVAALLIVFLKISLTSTPMLQGDYPYYPDVQSITDSADVIIVGEVVTSGDVQDLMVDRTPGKEDKEPIQYTLSIDGGCFGLFFVVFRSTRRFQMAVFLPGLCRFRSA